MKASSPEMSWLDVRFHESAWPRKARQALAESLLARRLRQRFLYESPAQARRWLALHEAFSPARTNPDFEKTYLLSFEESARLIENPSMQLISLGCGGGQKDAALVSALHKCGKRISYVPVDVSAALVLESAQAVVPEGCAGCSPIVMDLEALASLPALLPATPADSARVILLFGILPNVDPERILPALRDLLTEGGWLLVSANLVPGTDLREGMRKILPLYDNPLTRDWLLGFLDEVGISPDAGELTIAIESESGPFKLSRFNADFRFRRPSHCLIDGRSIDFAPGEVLQLFFSCRHTSRSVAELMEAFQMRVAAHWVVPSGEEGVFLIRRQN